MICSCFRVHGEDNVAVGCRHLTVAGKAVSEMQVLTLISPSFVLYSKYCRIPVHM